MPDPPHTRHFSTQQQALSAMGQLLRTCPEKIMMSIASGVDAAFIHKAMPYAEQHYCGACCTHASASGNTLTLTLKYKDDALILAVFRGAIPISRLTPLQRDIYRKALSVATRSKSACKQEYELARALHDWIVLNSRYVGNIHADGSLAGILLHGEGLCECYARSYRLLCRLAGLECRYITGTARRAHAWNLVRLTEKWVHVDCAFDDPVPDVQGRVLHNYFAKGDATFARDHSWNRHQYPACPADFIPPT